MATAQAYTPQPITVTEAAVNKIGQLIHDEENPQLKLRVYIEGGGCSGLQYGFAFDEEASEDDFQIEKDLPEAIEKINKVQLLIDQISYQYLVGAEIDYQADINGEQFIIRNPNAVTTCGCGSSFTVEDE